MASETASGFTEDFVAEYGRLYREYLPGQFEPALASLNLALGDLIRQDFDSSTRKRMRVGAGRIKSRNRLLEKASRPEYRDRISSPEEVFEKITDIVGSRVICNTTRDVYAVAGAISELCQRGQSSDGDPPSLGAVDIEPRDYIRGPKDSGYRAYHCYVSIGVPVGKIVKQVVAEVQIRTYLQDAWGELTHEDSYKPDTRIPPIVGALSKRLATVLAVMDELALDIRKELDRVVTAVEPKEDERPTSAQELFQYDESQQHTTSAETSASPRGGGSFEEIYPEGAILVGTAVYVGWDYALIQLRGGHTGILHWSKLGRPGHEYVDVSNYVTDGDTVEVSIIKTDPSRQRIELSLV